MDTELMLNGEARVAKLIAMIEWAKDGKFTYTGRRNEGGANLLRAVHAVSYSAPNRRIPLSRKPVCAA